MAEWKRRKKYRIDKDQEEPVVRRGYQITNLLRREFVLTLIFVAISTTALLGGSYAIFTNIQKAEQYNMIKSGTLQIAYDDTSSGLGNIIRLNGAFPESDVAGQEREPYRFKITNTGSLNAEYKVKILDDLSMIEEDGCQNKLLDKSVLKYSIDGGEPVLLSTIQDEYIAVNGNLSAGESITYEIRMWIDESAGNEVLGRHYHGKIVVEGEQMQKNLLGRASDVIFDLENIGDKGAIDTRDEEQTFITGEDPNNYVWYSGKLWRAVSKDSSDNSVKLVTQWPMTAIAYHGDDQSSNFRVSYVREWLNDTSVDGFLGNLREPEKFIKMDAHWHYAVQSSTGEIQRPPGSYFVVSTVGLLNIYEYRMSSMGISLEDSYLNNGTRWWLLSAPAGSKGGYVNETGTIEGISLLVQNLAVRPSVNLQPSVEIVAGDGTEENPYRLKNDFDEKQDDVFLNTRYSGEYVQFGAGENALYRIVSKELGGAKLVSAEPLIHNGEFLTKSFDFPIYTIDNPQYETPYFLNHDFLDSENGYLTSEQRTMIKDNSTWYLGDYYKTYKNFNYKIFKYDKATSFTTLTNNQAQATVGLLRVGEQFASRYSSNMEPGFRYWLLSLATLGQCSVESIYSGGFSNYAACGWQFGIRPSVHLKESVRITGGDGTKQNPFTISM